MKVKKEMSAGGIVCKITKSQNHKITRSGIVWLVTKHSKFGHWSFPKGLVGDVDEDEEIEAAALREVEEEGGVKAKIVRDEPITIRYKYRWKDFLIRKTVHYYLMRYISGDPKDHDWEVSEAKFLPIDEVEKLLTYKNDRNAFKLMIDTCDKLFA